MFDGALNGAIAGATIGAVVGLFLWIGKKLKGKPGLLRIGPPDPR